MLTIVLLAGCDDLFNLEPLAEPYACPSIATLCDGFEQGDTSAWTGEVKTPDSTALVTSTRVHAGELALELDVPPLFDGAFSAVYFDMPPLGTGTSAVRAWFNAAVPLDHYTSVALLRGPDMYLAVTGDQGSWNVTEGYGATTAAHMGDAADIVDRWTCVELVLTLGSPPSFSVFADDVRVVAMTLANPTPAFDRVLIGIPRADATGFHVFVDDVAIANERIGCQSSR